ncbi:MAG: hypothetical protein ACAI37_10045 [Chthoniobacter sp.]
MKLQLIARRLRAAGLHTVFLGHGIAHEMAAQSSDAFDEVLHAQPGDPHVAPQIASAAGLFSMMDREFAALALAQGKPVYVADSLRWMRDELPAPFAAAQRYWVQNFLPSVSSAKVTANTVSVGPIVEPRTPTPPERRHALVINLGGCETPAGPQMENFSYAAFILRGVLQSGALERFQGNVTLLAGSNAIVHLRAAFPRCGVTLRTAPHPEALDLFAAATTVFTAPGLTTALECFQFGMPTYFLPPQNYSQWRILRHLEESGLAAGSFTWSQVMNHFPALDTIPEPDRTPLLRQAIAEVSTAPHARDMFAASLQQRLATDGTTLAARQHAFFQSLGPNGAETIAGELIGLFGGERAGKAGPASA